MGYRFFTKESSDAEGDVKGFKMFNLKSRNILFNLYHDEALVGDGDPSDIVTRELLFPYPAETDNVKISMVEGEADVQGWS